MAMRSLGVTFLFALSVPVSTLAKEKPRITIQVVSSETSQRQYSYTTPGRKGTAQTNCTTNGTTNGTINDYGVGPIQTQSSGSANTNCTTTTTAATPPQTHTRFIAQEHVYAILPDGRHVILWCQQGYRRCDDLQPGSYEAEVDGNSLLVFVHEFSGKERKIKYRAVSVEEASAAAQQHPVSDSTAPAPPNTEAPPQAKSIETLKEQANSGDANAQCALGDLYLLGEGVPHDYAQAAAWYLKAAEQGNADAQNSLGAAYADGTGLPQDYAQAAIWYRKAAEQGLAGAQNSLGTLYANGTGLPQDYAEAYFWFDLAAAGNAAFAAKNRDQAASHLTPADLSRVQERARRWFEDHPAKSQ